MIDFFKTKNNEKKKEMEKKNEYHIDAVPLNFYETFPCKIQCDTNYFPNLQYEFGRVGVLGDGSCFFHSSSMCMFPKYFTFTNEERQNFVKKLRSKLGDMFTPEEHDLLHNKTNYPFKKRDFQNLKTAWPDISSWADESMIRFFSKKFKVNILFINFNTKNASFYCGVHGDESIGNVSEKSPWFTIPTFMIAWINGSHFEPICMKDTEHGVYRFLFDPLHENKKIRDMNRKIIKAIQEKYLCECLQK
jgi:hypothetical protein